ncbi:ankyrin repeat-containing domain protein [Xylariaceae sp. FL0804]|nr:ankyrin repeat-containing domain protein [Xylariaceae sp. FL0804]
MAARNDHPHALSVLQLGISKYTIDVDKKNRYGHTPPFLAAIRGHTTVMEVLLHHGASMDLPYNNGHTLLLIAANRRLTAVVEVLLHHGASIDLPDNNGSTPLSVAASLGNTGVVEVLLHHGASMDLPDNKDHEDHTPLPHAMSYFTYCILGWSKYSASTRQWRGCELLGLLRVNNSISCINHSGGS